MDFLGICPFSRILVLCKQLGNPAIGLVRDYRYIAQAVPPANDLIASVGAWRRFRLKPPLAITLPVCPILSFVAIQPGTDRIISSHRSPQLQKLLLVVEAGGGL